MRSDFLAASTNSAAAAALSTYGRTYFSTLPQSAQGFWSSVYAGESRAAAAQGTQLGYVVLSEGAAAVTTASAQVVGGTSTRPVGTMVSGAGVRLEGGVLGAAVAGVVGVVGVMML